MKKILIVEDDPAIAALLFDFLTEAGYKAVTAADGVEALTLFSAQAFDLILLDVMLPRIDGFGVCEVIRQKSKVPIIILTALDRELDQLVEERLFALEDLFVQKELDMKKELEPGIFIDGDRLMLAKAPDNLLSNAAAYSPAGSLVHVRLWPEAGHGMLTLENTGIHIPDADIPRLFEAFYRVDSSRNRMTGGSGLGLYIVNTILALHGGTADIANTAQGIEVSLFLPLHIIKQR